MQIACVLYDRFTMLDIIGPFQVLSSVPGNSADIGEGRSSESAEFQGVASRASPHAQLPGTEIVWVAEQAGPVVDHTGFVTMQATASFAEVTDPDIVVVPGGIGTELLIPDHPVIAWLADVHQRTQWTTSVCTGSLLLAAAGLLTDREATCHWLMMDALGDLGAVPVGRRVVIHAEDRIVTSAGVSSGIDMGLALVEQMHGTALAETIQLAIEYDPQPPVDAGSPEKASAEIQDLVRLSFAGL